MIAADGYSPFIEDTAPFNYQRKSTNYRLQRYTAAYKELFNSTELTSQQLESILSQWDSITSDSLAAMYTSEIKKEIGGFANRLVSSAGFREKFFEGLSNARTSGTNFSAEVKSTLLTIIQNYLTEYASLMKGQAVQGLITGAKIKADAAKTFSQLNISASGKVKLFDKETLSILSQSNDTICNRLGELIVAIKNATGGTITVGSGKNARILTPWGVVGYCSGLLNKLGGERIAEPVAVAIGQSIGAKMAKKFGPQELGKILEDSTLSDVKVKVLWDEALTAKEGQGKLSGKQITPDYTIEYHVNGGDGNFTITLPVSMKIRQSKQFLKGNKTLGTGFVKFGGTVTFEEALNLLSISGIKKQLEARWAVAFHHRRTTKGKKGRGKGGARWDWATYDDFSADNVGWNNLLTDVKIQVAQRSILGSLGAYEMSGSGGSVKADIISVVQINDTFYPATDIIRALTAHPDKRITLLKGKNLNHGLRSPKTVPLGTVQKEGTMKKNESAGAAPENARNRRKNKISTYIKKVYDTKIEVATNILK